jgi:hypothetical protein
LREAKIASTSSFAAPNQLCQKAWNGGWMGYYPQGGLLR